MPWLNFEAAVQGENSKRSTAKQNGTEFATESVDFGLQKTLPSQVFLCHPSDHQPLSVGVHNNNKQ